MHQAKHTEPQTSKQADGGRCTAVQVWETLSAQKASADSNREAILANRIALEGVEREAIVGSRTTLDVLNAQQVTLVQDLARLVNASHQAAPSG